MKISKGKRVEFTLWIVTGIRQCTNSTSECVHWQFRITYIFSVFVKLGVLGQLGEFRIKNATLYWHELFCHFLLFSSKKRVFIIFISFLWSIEFLQQNIKQSETRVDDTKFSVELYVHQLVKRKISKNDVENIEERCWRHHRFILPLKVSNVFEALVFSGISFQILAFKFATASLWNVQYTYSFFEDQCHSLVPLPWLLLETDPL